MRGSFGFALTLVGALAFAAPPLLHAQDKPAPASRPVEKRNTLADLQEMRGEKAAREAREKGARFLLATQEADGGWLSPSGPGITSLALKALIQEPSIGPQHAAVRKGVEFVLKSQRDDGGIYAAEGLQKNYESSVALSMFSVMHDSANDKRIAALRKFLIDNQWDESEQKSIDDPWYGGAGYGNGKRPDLSNTQMMLEALRDSGLSQDDPAYKRALVFIARCQMLGERNDQAFAKGATQGGFIYSPANGGESKAGVVEADGKKELRCYGTMTYSGYKSMLYCGLTLDDPRMQAAAQWIRRNWTLDHNPNMPEKQSQEGLFYYYHVFGRALQAMNTDIVIDAAGREHVWRDELARKLHKLQKDDGSWVNEADRWMEGHPALTTAYAMLALQAAFPEPPPATRPAP